MDRAEFCQRLGIDETALDGLIQEGLPWYGAEDNPEFDDSEVATWLVVHGKAEINQDRVARTASEAAVKLGIAKTTLYQWAHRKGFPGRTGYYPIDEIREWDSAQVKKLNQYATIEDVENRNGDKGQAVSVKERRDLLKLKKEQGLLVDVEEVKRDTQRANAYAVAELNLLSGKVESKLPAGLDGELVQIIRETIKDTVVECLTILAELENNYDDDEIRADD